MVTKLIVVFLFLVIIGSLGSAMFYMMRDTGNSKRMAKALTVRITLSVVAFLILILVGGPPNQSPF